ncbi:MFS transporter [Coniophora puteana RWD-64-598 SS2]|uniref:MFS transporter n=1 Tax=Coniophora puteana (strain RWD-64-598) TaxID=741705 RepID=A0A5M3MX26_CONPW|nr:MFS transporter [Coniophora puteana RWD-64-598 SS2]EIW83692.1 MFS transporter [Coniophora puteana RWD-64-598 SS2]
MQAAPPEPVRDEAVQQSVGLLSEQPEQRKSKGNPLPRGQILIVMLGLIIEPVASGSIYPYINQRTREAGTGERTKGRYYAGLIESLFFFTQFLTILHYSRLSDRVGRKPVLLLGTFALSLSMLCFGLSKTFTTLVLSRCITGALNGNIGVMKSMMGEMSDSTNMARAFSLMPIAWSTGGVLGPAIGGILSRPQDHWPHLFSGAFWAEYPYFLPSAIAAGFAMFTFLIMLFFLKETLPRRSTHDKSGLLSDREGSADGYGTFGSSDSTKTDDEPVPLRALLIPSILTLVANYGVIAILETSIYVLIPLYFSTPIELGGLGFDPRQIGYCLIIFGFINGFFQAFCFAPIIGRLGPKTFFTLGVTAYIPVFLCCPLANYITFNQGMTPTVWGLLAIVLICAVLQDSSFSCIMMFITAAAPNKRSLGATNGLAQMTGSIARAVGPAVATSMFAYSAGHDVMGGYAVYVLLMFVAFGSLRLASYLPEELGQKSLY